MQTGNSESEESWSEFFASLKERGLKGLELVVSDDHRGLVRAVQSCFQEVAWQRKLRTTNSVERLNEEIRRRGGVIRIFPNRASAVRMVGALLIEQHEEWSEGRKYFDMTQYWDWKAEQEKPGSKLSRITA